MFAPPRRRGLILQTTAAVLLLAAAGACGFIAFRLPVGSGFVLLSLAGLIFFTPVPLLLYRIYALLASEYLVERNGLRLRWGLVAEDIPILEIEWVRPATDLVLPLPLPRLAWSGALLGTMQVPDLGAVEFLAADLHTLLLIATPRKIYAISPANPGAFLKTFRNTIEMGSIENLPPLSARPAAFLRQVWGDRLARFLTASGLVLSLLVFLAIGLGIGSRAMVPLGFGPDRQPLAPVPAEQVLLLPFLASMAFAIDLLLGLLLYRREGLRPIAYVLWLGGLVTPLIFLIAAWFIL
jgi:hypothetical protein